MRRPTKPRSSLTPLVCAAAALLARAAPLEAKPAGTPCADGLEREWETLEPGVELLRESCAKPLYKAFAVKVDLAGGGHRIIATPKKKMFSTVRSFGESTGSVVATNGGFFDSVNGGYFMSFGKEHGKHADTQVSSVVGFGTDGKGHEKVRIFPPEQVMTKGKAPSWMAHGLTGVPLLVRDGAIPASWPENSMWEVRHPRTGIGTSAKEGWALIAVVDGRQAGWSKGMTIDQWALFFLSHGATDALNLDGGASSAMFVASKGDIVNRMCKPRGNERKVANHIGILPAGSAAAAAGMLLPAAIARALFGGPRGFLAWGRS